MCDTVVASGNTTRDGCVLFGKNSDRQRNEAHVIQLLAAESHVAGSTVNCTYLTLPQIPHTHAVLLCRPFWIWGAEMGANQHGVVIGNEGLHARSPAPEASALTGMDLVRLALERATSASQAVDVITTLLETYGQGGNCGHLTPHFYNNGFLIVDRQEAYVLETIDRDWILEQVAGVRTISNCYSIRNSTRVSNGIERLLREFGWTDREAPENYADIVGSPGREHLGFAQARRARSTSLLRSGSGKLDALSVMSVLRDHDGTECPAADGSPEFAVTRTLCMHAGSEDRPGQTTGSLVSAIGPNDAVHWVTGTAAPCLSIFKPLLMDVPFPRHEPPLSDRFDIRTGWWRHELLHRAVILDDFPGFLRDITPERDALERSFHGRVDAVTQGGDAADRAHVIRQCWHDAEQMERRWLSAAQKLLGRADSVYRTTWLEFDRLAEMPR